MKQVKKDTASAGFSLMELMIAMTITLLLLALVSGLFAKALGTRARESRRTDALTSAQAALNIMSHEISDAGYGIYSDPLSQRASNGIVINDSNQGRLHFRANIENVSNLETVSPGEDVTYFFDSGTNSIVRYDAHGVDAATPLTSVVVNGISNVTFTYFDYAGSSSIPTPVAGSSSPTVNTGRVRINITVTLDHVQGQPDNQTVSFTSDVTLRNSSYMLNQY